MSARCETIRPDDDIPAWFVENNIKSNHDLKASGPQIRFVNHAEIVGRTGSQRRAKENANEEPFKYEVDANSYVEVREITASTLIPDTTQAFQTDTIFFKELTFQYLDFHDQVVAQLAEDLDANFLSIGLPDLEALAEGSESIRAILDEKPELLVDDGNTPKNEQVEEETNVETSPASEALSISSAFITSNASTPWITPDGSEASSEVVAKCNKNSEASPETDQKKVVTLKLKPHTPAELAKLYLGIGAGGGNATHDPDQAHNRLHLLLKMASEGLQAARCRLDTRRLFIHFRDTLELVKDCTGLKEFLKLRETIRSWRKASGWSVTFFTSAATENSHLRGTTSLRCGSAGCAIDDDYYLSDDEKLRKHVCPEKIMGFEWAHSDFPAHIAHVDNITPELWSIRNERWIKFNLKMMCSDVLDPVLLNADFRWNFIHDHDRFPDLAKSHIGDIIQKRLCTRLKGRSLGRSQLGISDIEAVFCSLYPTSGILKGADSKSSNRLERSGFQKKLENIKGTCTEFETQLLSCVIDPDAMQSTYEDVIIDPEIKSTLHHLVNVSKIRFEGPTHPLIQHMRIKGALFYGPPGTGKTHLCRAIAKSSGANMLAVEAAHMQNKWVGDTEKAIAAAFSLATKLKPCILFIDEVDALFYRRSSSDKSWQRCALTQLLQAMDGLKTTVDSPFVIAATNRPVDIDEAFLRRLPQKVYFTLPEIEERAAIIKLHIKDEDLDESATISEMVARTKGYSGSDLYNFCQQAAWAWMTEQMRTKLDTCETVITEPLKLSQRHIDKALERIKPSVSSLATQELEAFARRFNPEALDRSRKAQLAADEDDLYA